MSTRRFGKIERVIAAKIAEALMPNRFDAAEDRDPAVLLNSWTLTLQVYRPEDRWLDGGWRPSLAQRKAVTRAMHSFVRKNQQYALIGGQGRRSLYLYDTASPLSVMWAELSAANGFTSKCDAFAALKAAPRFKPT